MEKLELTLCSAEIMKMIKDLEEEKCSVIHKEDNHSLVSYKEGEKKSPSDYDYNESRQSITKINDKIRYLKFALQKANCSTWVLGFDMTVSEALVYLAQLTSEYDQLSHLSRRIQISRRITPNGVLEYTECMFDVKQAEKDKFELKTKIGKLQVAIDRANLTNEIAL